MENISIATTTFNDEKNIISLLDQLVNQTTRPDEIVIADGGSKDNTVAVVKGYAATCPIHICIISDGKRRNIPQGFNDAIKETRNNWVLVMGTGNSYHADFIEKMVDEQQKTDAKVLYSTIVGNETSIFAHWFNQYFLRGNRIQNLDISNHGMLIEKTVFSQIGYFWENFVYAGEDLEFSRRVHKNNIKCLWVKDAVAYWDTPQTWKDYTKKMSVNSIADWQIEESSQIVKRCAVQGLVLLAWISVIIWKPIALFLLFPLIAFVGYKKGTASIPAICLGLFNRYLMIWYYLKNRRYKDPKYHIPVEYKI